MDFSIFYAEDAAMVGIFSLSHLIYFIFCIFAIYSMIRNHKEVLLRKNDLRKFFLGIITFQQVILLYGWYFFVTDFDITVALPFHICRVASLLTIVFLINGNKKLLDIIFYFGLFAIGSLCYPKDIYNFLHMQGWSYMINHLVTVLIPIFAYIAYDWKPTWAGFRRSIVVFTCFFLFVYNLNPLIDGNYFYLVDRPFLNSLTYAEYGLFTYCATVSGYAVITKLFLVCQAAYDKRHLPKNIKFESKSA